MSRSRIVALALAAAAVIGIGVSAGAASQTQAAWTDPVYVTATTTAGSWVSGNSCTAWAMGGTKLASCEVKGIRVSGWIDGAGIHRQYYVDFATPSQAEFVDFSIDLTTATGNAPEMDWSKANVQGNAQFIPTDGWTSVRLPTVTGRTIQWNTQTMFFELLSPAATGR